MNNTINLDKIIQNPLFLKLKGVVENNEWHDHEDMYTHSTKTKDLALKMISADFISNPTAKEKFISFINEDLHGFKRADLMILIALLHDVGKILSFKEGGQIKPLEVTDSNGITSPPGHEYWGSTIVDQVLKDLNLNQEAVNYIAKGVKLHGAFQAEYLPLKKDWPMDKLLNDIKSKAEGMHIESMFNNLCDVYTAPPFEPYKDLVIKIFNEPYLYEKREYIIT